MANSASSEGVERISTYDALKLLGFVEDYGGRADPPPSLRFDFGNFQLWASRMMSLRFRQVVVLHGIFDTMRVLARVETEMPETVESVELAAAWVVWTVDKAAGRPFLPDKVPSWMAGARTNFGLLPWVRYSAAQEALYAARPRCTIEREWARLALKTLGAELSSATEDSRVLFSFDGHLLTIRFQSMVLAVPATGKPWNCVYSISAKDLQPLPRRLQKQVRIEIDEPYFHLNDRGYRGIREHRADAKTGDVGLAEELDL